MSYTVIQYGKMLDDKWRMDSYISAIKKHINNNSIVLDLGAGTGIFSLLACQLGAKKVYAIEPNPSLNIAIKSAKDNGYSDKIIFFNKPSEQVNLREKVDLIISDLRGLLPLHGNNINTLIDAKKRFLKKNGVLIPYFDEIYISLVSSPKLYNDIIDCWDNNDFKLNLSYAKYSCLNTFYFDDFKSSKLISESKLWAKIDYSNLNKKNFQNRFNFKVSKKTIIHGFSTWFNSKLTSGINLINSPDAKGAKVYGRAFFPFLEPLHLDSGDRVSLLLKANLIAKEYKWSWKTEHYKKYKKIPIKTFSQSTIFLNPISPEKLIKGSQNYKTSMNEAAIIQYKTLYLFSKGLTILNIGKKIYKEFPKKFVNLNEAITFVGDLSIKYCK